MPKPTTRRPQDLTFRWRDLPTRELPDECEHWRLLWAELASDPGDCPYPADSHEYIEHKLAGIEAEIGRRQRLRQRPEAPPWPDHRDRRAELAAIKARLSVKWFFETYTPVTLHQAGQYWRGCCPIHDGDNPTSLVVSDAWYCCHSCGAKGDLFTAARQIFDLDSFGAAVAVLADMAGIERTEPPPELRAQNSLVLAQTT